MVGQVIRIYNWHKRKKIEMKIDKMDRDEVKMKVARLDLVLNTDKNIWNSRYFADQSNNADMVNHRKI